jgi:AraC-like DNA-binding protein
MSDLMTVAQVAAVLNCSEETVTRRFAKEKGVIDIASAGNTRRRRYRVLRIPRAVVEKYALQDGGRITVEPPAKPVKSKPTILPTEDELVHDLATLAQQHGEAARQTLTRIVRRARAMTHVPNDRWQDMVWVDEDD